MARSSVALAVVVAVTVALTGCTASPDAVVPPVASPSVAPSGDGGLQALPPTIVSPGELDGTDVSVVIGTALVLAVDDGTEDHWHGTTADVTVAEFSAGGSDEGATFRPGFQARSLGSTAATLTSPEGRRIDFTLTVVAP